VRPEDLSLVADDAVRRLVVAPRYTGKILLHFELICYNGGIRECAVSTTKTITNEEVAQLQEKKDVDITP
jgi:hypothetical protein